ncbi:MAG: hypothetical protein JST87_10070 [Bacteroidetes bacterium]|nr:hypothetical protein [Bacteroidota bacterium]MBS1935725.1 hypothetical protein [Bacteroidota bacterium]
MQNEEQNKRTKGYILMRAIMDYGMGIMILGFGIFFIIAPKLGYAIRGGDFFRYFFAVLCIIYGTWRIYRGYKKNYFRS